jgi:hypothetical protein
VSGAFDPTDYPRRYRMRLGSRLFMSIMCLIVPFLSIRLVVIAALKPAPSMILIPLIAMPIVFIPMFVWLLAFLWRGVLTLHPDRIVYGPWPREKTILRTELAGFRVGDFKHILILIPRDKPRDAFVIAFTSIEKDAAFWRWLETLETADSATAEG